MERNFIALFVENYKKYIIEKVLFYVFKTNYIISLVVYNNIIIIVKITSFNIVQIFPLIVNFDA